MHLTNRRLSLHCVVSPTTVLFSSRYLLPLWLFQEPDLSWSWSTLHSLTGRYSLTGKSSHMLKALYSLLDLSSTLPQEDYCNSVSVSFTQKEVVISWNKPIGRTVLIHSSVRQWPKWWLQVHQKLGSFHLSALPPQHISLVLSLASHICSNQCPDAEESTIFFLYLF